MQTFARAGCAIQPAHSLCNAVGLRYAWTCRPGTLVSGSRVDLFGETKNIFAEYIHRSCVIALCQQTKPMHYANHHIAIAFPPHSLPIDRLQHELANAGERGQLLQSLSDELHSSIAGLRRYALALVGNGVDADDLVQETLQRGLAAMRDGRRIDNMRGYLFTILHNIRASQLRRGDSRNNTSLDDMTFELPVAPNQENVVQLKELFLAISALPMEQKSVISLVCLEGFSYRQTADILDIPIGTVMSRLSRARRVLIDGMDSTNQPKLAEIN